MKAALVYTVVAVITAAMIVYPFPWEDWIR